MLGITDYAWRLVPANPILLRVVESGGRRRRDLFIRCAYLGLLVFVVITSLVSGQSTVGAGASLNDLAKMSGQIFENMSYLQLGLVALLAPIFTAGAITQEKDSQTYDILLSTPLTNGQIVLGSLLSRLFFVIALLISGIPIFSITQVFGGVSIASIVKSFGIAAATAFVTGALAMAIAVFKVGTRRTIFSFYLFIVIFLVGVFLLDRLPYFKVPVITDPTTGAVELGTTSWFTGIHPFLALETIFRNESYQAPDLLQLPENLRGWPVGWYLSNPANFYTTFMFALSFVLVTPSIVVLRRLAQSTVSLKTWLLQKLKVVKSDRTRKPRYVWSNPIAWREARTKASAARASLMRYGFMAAGVVGALVLVVMFSRVREPDKFVGQSSYNAQYRTLTVYSGSGASAQTYQVLPGQTSVLLEVRNAINKNQWDPKEYDLNQLRGKMEVTNLTPIGGGQRRGIAAITLRQVRRMLDPSEVRQYLLGAAVIEFAVILLIVTNAAASTVTREKEDGSLDLLLTTPITSRYYIWGKLRGLVSFVLPLVAVPVISVLLFVIYDVVRRMGAWDDPAFQWIVFPEAVLILPGMLIIVAAFAAILGMHMSLRCRTTVLAVMSSVGIVVGICAALGWCGGQLVSSNSGPVGLAIGSFSPFTIMTVLIDPYSFAEHNFQSNGFGATEESTSRFVVFIFSWVAVGGYTLVVWSMYKSMVKNFDMTIRRQSR
jgi:ABC-type transport system involved in multi-copper enzyme maturation permease subunit